MVKRPSLLLAAFAAALALTGSSSAVGNPFGLTVVRFSAQTTPAQMRAAVASAGGVVVSDLSEIGAFGVVPRSAGFAARLSANRAVSAVFQDSVLTTNRGPDDRARGGPGPEGGA